MDSEGFRSIGGFDSEIEETSPCGRYVRYKKIIGRGAFKEVYRGLDLVDNFEIAWNQISIEDDKNLNSLISGESQWFEAVLLKSLEHTNIMRCYCHWVDPQNRCVNIITELFNSGNLRQYMKKLANVDQQTIKNWGRQILHGLTFLHCKNPKIVHRDLKCDNIFVDSSSGEIKLGDFGLSTIMEECPIRDLAGTPEFMAPEYYDEEYDELVDLYSFGMCLLEISTLECPYSECTNQAQIFKKVTSGIKPRALGRVMDLEVKEVIEKCLSPVSLRPSAVELLKHPFFSNEVEIVSVISSMDSCCLNDVSQVEVNSRMEDRYCCISEADMVLSDISTLYNPTVSGASFDAKKGGCCCESSSLGDVSMTSRITYDSL